MLVGRLAVLSNNMFLFIAIVMIAIIAGDLQGPATLSSLSLLLVTVFLIVIHRVFQWRGQPACQPVRQGIDDDNDSDSNNT